MGKEIKDHISYDSLFSINRIFSLKYEWNFLKCPEGHKHERGRGIKGQRKWEKGGSLQTLTHDSHGTSFNILFMHKAYSHPTSLLQRFLQRLSSFYLFSRAFFIHNCNKGRKGRTCNNFSFFLPQYLRILFWNAHVFVT